VKEDFVCENAGVHVIQFLCCLIASSVGNGRVLRNFVQDICTSAGPLVTLLPLLVTLVLLLALVLRRPVRARLLRSTILTY